MELDELFKHKQRGQCKDDFINTLTDEALDKCTIPEINLNDFEGMSEDEAPQEKLSDSEGDDEDKLQFQYLTHDLKVKWNTMKPFRRERYESPHQLKLCLTNYSISRGYLIRFKKCDNVRLVAICASNPEKFQCPFIVRASWMSTKRSFQIKKPVEQHTCVRNFRSANIMDPTWIARQFLKEMVRKPNLKWSFGSCKGCTTTCGAHRMCKTCVCKFQKGIHWYTVQEYVLDSCKSTVEGDFKLNMEKIREVNPAAYDHLMAREPKSWCKSFFKGGMACEYVENGMAECFNAIVLGAREKYLLARLEEIRLYMMENVI
ncbi:unnamed protein product [Lactuca saligna]|uniref:Transposase MuDR plant domain-containing protein n=1 Tax=Lactuca saligna TaxID=75948 RepID=A0AA35UZ63_LACSI|nr:unnamed protein product [Lactuca saligna]